jgi:hypothetical protein
LRANHGGFLISFPKEEEILEIPILLSRLEI